MHRLIAIEFLAFLSVVSCQDPDSHVNVSKAGDEPLIYSDGSRATEKYEDGKFGFSIEYPKNWTRWTQDQVRARVYEMALAETGDRARAELEASIAGANQLLTLFKYPTVISGQYNPSIMVSAVSAETFAKKGIPDFQALLSLRRNPPAPRFSRSTQGVLEGSKVECWQTRVVGNYPDGVRIFQDAYDYDLGEFWINIIVSTDTESEAEDFRKLALSLRRIEALKSE